VPRHTPSHETADVRHLGNAAGIRLGGVGKRTDVPLNNCRAIQIPITTIADMPYRGAIPRHNDPYQPLGTLPKRGSRAKNPRAAGLVK
jgi:hypothetical protein